MFISYPHFLAFFYPGRLNSVAFKIPINHADISWHCHSNGELHTHRYRYRRELLCLRHCKEKSRYEVCQH